MDEEKQNVSQLLIVALTGCLCFRAEGRALHSLFQRLQVVALTADHPGVAEEEEGRLDHQVEAAEAGAEVASLCLELCRTWFRLVVR